MGSTGSPIAPAAVTTVDAAGPPLQPSQAIASRPGSLAWLSSTPAFNAIARSSCRRRMTDAKGGRCAGMSDSRSSAAMRSSALELAEPFSAPESSAELFCPAS